MHYYAQLNSENVCVGVSSLSGVVHQPNMIAIPSADEDYLYRKYENGEWSVEKYIPESGQVELTRVEALEQSQADQDEIIMQLLLGGV